MSHPHKPLQHYLDSLPADLTVCALLLLSVPAIGYLAGCAL
ncbi:MULTISPECIES: hypothetical protein [Nocardia]|nr:MULTISPECIES: hypothetical protein [Nocardia]